MDNCYLVCAKRQDVPFLTNMEGACFRNCITKFSTFYPSRTRANANAAYHFYEQKLVDEFKANNEEFAEVCRES